MGNPKSKIKTKKKISDKEIKKTEISINNKEIEYIPPPIITPNQIINSESQNKNNKPIQEPPKQAIPPIKQPSPPPKQDTSLPPPPPPPSPPTPPPPPPKNKDEEDENLDEGDDKDDENILEKEIIVLINLKNIKKIQSYGEFKDKEEKVNTKEEIEEIEEKTKLKNKSLKIHYKINKEKIKELEKTFKSSKLKVNLINPINLENGNLCSISENKKMLVVYENKYFNKLTKIFASEITSVIQLDNNDIIVLSIEKFANIYIYRLKDNNYFRFQKIIEDRNGYALQDETRGCLISEKKFELEWIKKLSKNKFMTISNYGFKIYSLNENNQYSLILMDTHEKGIT